MRIVFGLLGVVTASSEVRAVKPPLVLPERVYIGPELRARDSVLRDEDIDAQTILSEAYESFQPTEWCDDFKSSLFSLIDDIDEDGAPDECDLSGANYQVQMFLDRIALSMSLSLNHFVKVAAIMDVNFQADHTSALLSLEGIPNIEVFADQLFYAPEPSWESLTDMFEIVMHPKEDDTYDFPEEVVVPSNMIRTKIIQQQKHRALSLLHAVPLSRVPGEGTLQFPLSSVAHWRPFKDVPRPDAAETVVEILSEWIGTVRVPEDVVELDAFSLDADDAPDEVVDWLMRIQKSLVIPNEVFQFMLALNQVEGMHVEAALEEKITDYNNGKDNALKPLELSAMINWYVCYTRQFAGFTIDTLPFTLVRNLYVLPPLSLVNEIVFHILIDLV